MEQNSRAAVLVDSFVVCRPPVRLSVASIHDGHRRLLLFYLCSRRVADVGRCVASSDERDSTPRASSICRTPQRNLVNLSIAAATVPHTTAAAATAADAAASTATATVATASAAAATSVAASRLCGASRLCEGLSRAAARRAWCDTRVRAHPQRRSIASHPPHTTQAHACPRRPMGGPPRIELTPTGYRLLCLL